MIRFITHRTLLFSRSEVWLYEGGDAGRSAYTVFIAALSRPPGNLVKEEPYSTVNIALGKTEEELFQEIHSRLRYDIRLAQKKGMEFSASTSPSVEECERTCAAFNDFIKGKPIAPLSKQWMLQAARAGKLAITVMKHEGKEVVSHIFLRDGGVTLNTQSFHHTDYPHNEISKFANKLLHWNDILFFKKLGDRCYNFGPVNPQLKGITQFKTNFGGTIQQQFRFIRCSPVLYSIIRRFKKN